MIEPRRVPPTPISRFTWQMPGPLRTVLMHRLMKTFARRHTEHWEQLTSCLSLFFLQFACNWFGSPPWNWFCDLHYSLLITHWFILAVILIPVNSSQPAWHSDCFSRGFGNRSVCVCLANVQLHQSLSCPQATVLHENCLRPGISLKRET